MLSPLSVALDGSSPADGSDAVTFMSGSGSASGITIEGSSPGCQRSMLSAEPPSDVPPKNRLAVFTEKPSCEGVGSSGIRDASGALFRSASGCASSDIETSYCGMGGRLRDGWRSGSSRQGSALSADAYFGLVTQELDVR